MTFRVVKAFVSVNRRFVEGAEISADEDLSPHTAEGLVAAGYLASPTAPQPAPIHALSDEEE